MIRIVGILCGSAIAIAFLIVALGIPKLSTESDDPVAPPLADVTDTSGAPATETQPEPIPEPVPRPLPLPEVAPAPAQAQAQAQAQAPDSATDPTSTKENWFAFWSPFRSELAANGFVSQLQRTTGLDYRVVRLEAGVYEVAFAYDAESDIVAKLETISAATGLEMPDG